MTAIERGDLARARQPVFERHVRAALDIIKQASLLGRIGVSYSGGKDSTVTLDLVRQIVPDAPAAFYDSGCEYPGTYEMVAHYGVQIIKPEMSLPEMCKYGGYWGHENPTDPNAEFDFFSFLVQEPSYQFETLERLAVIAMGLRAQESGGRRMSARKRGELYQIAATGVWHLCPLAFWDEDDVWAYLASRHLRYNSAYDRMAELGIPRKQWRVGMLLGMTKPGLQERYGWLRQCEPELFRKLATDFPKILSYT